MTVQTLAASPAQIVQALLIQLGLGADPVPYATGTGSGTDWPVFSEGEPALPDNVLTTYTTVGVLHGRSMPTGETLDHFGFQVRIRAKDHTTGWLKADAVRATLAQQVLKTQVTVGAGTYLVYAVAKIGQVLRLGKEVGVPTKRSLFTVNALLSVRQLS